MTSKEIMREQLLKWQAEKGRPSRVNKPWVPSNKANISAATFDSKQKPFGERNVGNTQKPEVNIHGGGGGTVLSETDKVAELQKQKPKSILGKRRAAENVDPAPQASRKQLLDEWKKQKLQKAAESAMSKPAFVSSGQIDYRRYTMDALPNFSSARGSALSLMTADAPKPTLPVKQFNRRQTMAVPNKPVISLAKPPVAAAAAAKKSSHSVMGPPTRPVPGKKIVAETTQKTPYLIGRPVFGSSAKRQSTFTAPVAARPRSKPAVVSRKKQSPPAKFIRKANIHKVAAVVQSVGAATEPLIAQTVIEEPVTSTPSQGSQTVHFQEGDDEMALNDPATIDVVAAGDDLFELPVVTRPTMASLTPMITKKVTTRKSLSTLHRMSTAAFKKPTAVITKKPAAGSSSNVVGPKGPASHRRETFCMPTSSAAAGYRFPASDNKSLAGGKTQQTRASKKTTPYVSRVMSAKVTPAKISLGKMKLTKVTLAKAKLANVTPGKVKLAKVTPAKVKFAKVTPAKVNSAKVSPVNVILPEVSPAMDILVEVPTAKVSSPTISSAILSTPKSGQTNVKSPETLFDDATVFAAVEVRAATPRVRESRGGRSTDRPKLKIGFTSPSAGCVATATTPKFTPSRRFSPRASCSQQLEQCTPVTGILKTGRKSTRKSVAFNMFKKDTPKFDQTLRANLTAWLANKKLTPSICRHLHCLGGVTAADFSTPKAGKSPSTPKLRRENTPTAMRSARIKFAGHTPLKQIVFNEPANEVPEIANEAVIPDSPPKQSPIELSQQELPSASTAANVSTLQGASTDLLRLLEESYPPEKVSEWLDEMYLSNPVVQELAEYWECRAMVSASCGDVREAKLLLDRGLLMNAQPCSKLAAAKRSLSRRGTQRKSSAKKSVQNKQSLGSTVVQFEVADKSATYQKVFGLDCGPNRTPLARVTPVRRSQRLSRVKIDTPIPATPSSDRRATFCVDTLNDIPSVFRQNIYYADNPSVHLLMATASPEMPCYLRKRVVKNPRL